MEKTKRRYTTGEEIAHSITHGIGAGLAIAGLVILLVYSARYGTAIHVVASALYGSTLTLMFLNSTLYHAITAPRAKRVFRILDHSAIFLLIAGSYTPFTIVSIRGGWGWSLFGVVWGLAVLGILFEIFFMDRYKWITAAFYLGMGWIVVLAWSPLKAAMHPAGIRLIFIGGIFYTVGIVFYALKRIPFNHVIWHLFVIGGAVSHYFTMLYYVVPPVE